ncbi:MAG: FAD-binding oxidoreductase [Mucilaginibacter sp.]
MEKHIVKVLETNFVTHNVKSFVVEKPVGYSFIPGQATDVAINEPGLENELRPFTFTSLNTSDHLEFIIKIYKGHDGITEKLSAIEAGGELIIHEVFGAINYKGPGVFIAAGAGITPFMAILRQLNSEDLLSGNTLLFANHSDDDIILKEELVSLLGDNCLNILSQPSDPNIPGRVIDCQLLQQHYKESANYYICGPDKFTEMVVSCLNGLGVSPERIILEQ